ncbi:hypothetical protein [Brachybacterium endophyticum]|nr:hypothetical protein [Brachybacterium endophyticum]
MNPYGYDVIGGAVLITIGLATFIGFIAHTALLELHQRHARKKGPTR